MKDEYKLSEDPMKYIKPSRRKTARKGGNKKKAAKKHDKYFREKEYSLNRQDFRYY